MSDSDIFTIVGTTIITLNKNTTGELTIPNYITNIGAWAFVGCTGLTSIIIPSDVTRIGRGLLLIALV